MFLSLTQPIFQKMTSLVCAKLPDKSAHVISVPHSMSWTWNELLKSLKLPEEEEEEVKGSVGSRVVPGVPKYIIMPHAPGPMLLENVSYTK